MTTEMDNAKPEATETYTFLSISLSHLWFLRLASFLQLKDKSFSHPLSLLLQLWDHVSVVIFNSMWTGFGIRMIIRHEVDVEYICEEVAVNAFCLRYLVVCFKRVQLCRLIEFCERLWEYLEVGEDMVVRQFERKGHFFRQLILINVLAVATLYVITAHFIRLPPLEANGTERRMLPYRFFLEIQEEPAFSIVYVMQIVVVYFVNTMFASVETVSLYLIMMACGYLRSIQNRLLNLAGSYDDSDAKGEAAFKRVTDCARFHQQIMMGVGFCEEVDRMTRMLFLFSCFCPIYNLSITGIKLLENDEGKFKFAAILSLNLFQFFACQWAPEFLINESEAVGTAAYFASLQPFASSHRERINRILYFMMMRAQKPIQLTAGGFIPLSIQTFGAMVRSAFSFFMVLRSFRT